MYLRTPPASSETKKPQVGDKVRYTQRTFPFTTDLYLQEGIYRGEADDKHSYVVFGPHTEDTMCIAHKVETVALEVI